MSRDVARRAATEVVSEASASLKRDCHNSPPARTCNLGTPEILIASSRSSGSERAARDTLSTRRVMSAPFKVIAQAKAKGEKMKADKKIHAGKKKQTKAAAGGKTKGGGPIPAAAVQPAAEKIVHEPEAAGEDDHAFFDDEDNADYAKFMLSLDSSGLTTFSKRTKDRVAVPPTSKKKSKQLHKSAESPQPAAPKPEQSAGASSESSTAAAAVDDAPPDAAGSKAPPTKKAKKEAVVDAKRRKASTAGWVVEDSGPARLPIKTRRGLLKPNERMQQQQQQSGDVPSHESGPGEKLKAENGKSAGNELDAETEAAAPGTAEGTGSNEQANGDGGVDDPMSESDNSVYDSGDDSAAEYSMDDFDDSAGGNGGPRVSIGGGGGGGRKVDLAVLRQRRFEQKKALMGELCESILAAPEESLMRPKTVAKGEEERSRMEQLFALVSLHRFGFCRCSCCSLLRACLVCSCVSRSRAYGNAEYGKAGTGIRPNLCIVALRRKTETAVQVVCSLRPEICSVLMQVSSLPSTT